MGNMKFCLCLVLWLTLMASSFLWAQKISNVRVEQDPELRYYKISFDLSGNASDEYLVQVVPYKNNRELSRLSFLTGAGIREPISSRKNHCIFWDAILEGYESEGWQFRISSVLSSKDMVLVEGGTFMMGSNDGDGDEKPVHEVTLSSFWIGKYQVTQQEWMKVMGSNPSRWKGDRLPVENVSWYDAVEYCNKRSIQEGLTPCYSGSGNGITCNWRANGYRLPTEAEWEFAARGGLKSKGCRFSGSNDISSVAWYSSNSQSKTHEVGTRQPNELGIYDMSGNVWEWCWDIYGSYPSGAQTNPHGATGGTYRVGRGGSWGSGASYCTVSYRNINDAANGGSNLGFRVCRVSP